MRKKIVLYFVLLTLLLHGMARAAASVCSPTNVHISRLELIEILRRDGFSLPLNIQDEFARLGEIQIGKSCFVNFLYTSEYRPGGPGTNLHFAARLLVLRDYKYIGMFQLDNENLPKRIRGNRVEFPGEGKADNFIAFSVDGPPKTVWLNGEMREFIK